MTAPVRAPSPPDPAAGRIGGMTDPPPAPRARPPVTVGRPSLDRARLIAAEGWGLDVRVEPLGGWTDSNFLLRTADGDASVLKISPPETAVESLRNESSALVHLAATELAAIVPRVVPARDGRLLLEIIDEAGATRWARMVTYLEGSPLAEVAARPPRLLEELGRLVARVDLALADFDHPATRRTHEWDLMATPTQARHLPRIADPRHRELVADGVDRFREAIVPRVPELEHGVIHGDANDHNLLVRSGAEGPRPAGIIDFGDLLETAVIAELAIALAYLMLDRDDPFADAEHLTRGFNEVRPLNALERELLPDLVLGRVCASILHAAHGQARAPGNDYLQISAGPMRRLIERLSTADAARLQAAVGAGCR